MGADPRAGRASVAQLDGRPRRRLYAGRDPARAVSVDDLRAMAHRRLPAFALEYLEGGAGDESALACNRAAIEALRLVPRALVDVSRRELGVTLLGRRRALPIAIAPTGLNGLYRRDADLMLAQAAADAGIPFVQSTMSNVPLERVASTRSLQHWWQLYVFGAPEVSHGLVRRALAAGCEALVLTTDAQSYGPRDWEHRRLRASGWPDLRSIADAAMHPRWLATTLSHGLPRFGTLEDLLPPERRSVFRASRWVRERMQRGLDWRTVADLRSRWPRPLLLKGLLDPDDVARAVDAGVDAVVLSNHGGRQFDAAPSPLDCLPAARRAAAGRVPLLVDGGIRRGADVAKAVALGADAVLVGRAALYGVAAAGRAGAARALEILRDELDLCLALAGATSVAQLRPRPAAAAAAGPHPAGPPGSVTGGDDDAG